MGLGESQRQDQGVSSTWRVSTEETRQPGREGWRVGLEGEQEGLQWVAETTFDVAAVCVGNA